MQALLSITYTCISFEHIVAFVSMITTDEYAHNNEGVLSTKSEKNSNTALPMLTGKRVMNPVTNRRPSMSCLSRNCTG